MSLLQGTTVLPHLHITVDHIGATTNPPSHHGADSHLFCPKLKEVRHGLCWLQCKWAENEIGNLGKAVATNSKRSFG